jgi:hypothetical protein
MYSAQARRHHLPTSSASTTHNSSPTCRLAGEMWGMRGVPDAVVLASGPLWPEQWNLTNRHQGSARSYWSTFPARSGRRRWSMLTMSARVITLHVGIHDRLTARLSLNDISISVARVEMEFC